jgi:lipoprotein-releasing system permease protein
VQLGAYVGDVISVLTMQSATLSPVGPMARPRPLKVVGISNLGLYEYDHAFGFVSLETASTLFRRDQVDMMQLKVDNLDRAGAVAVDVEDRLGAGYLAQDWAELNQALYSALWLEKTAIGITIGLIMMVAALNIVASLILLVMEKSRDIAILKTMGVTSRSIRNIFVLQGGLIGTAGTLVGALGGVTLSVIADRYQLIQVPMDVYDIAWVPFRVQIPELVLVVSAAVLVCLLATIYPSRQASRLDPAEALRYE